MFQLHDDGNVPQHLVDQEAAENIAAAWRLEGDSDVESSDTESEGDWSELDDEGWDRLIEELMSDDDHR